MRNLVVSPAVAAKLKIRHGVRIPEIQECFSNRAGRLLVDTRALNQTKPPTLWFLASTDNGRLLKIVYIQSGLKVHLKTAYEPNEVERAIYRRLGEHH